VGVLGVLDATVVRVTVPPGQMALPKDGGVVIDPLAVGATVTELEVKRVPQSAVTRTRYVSDPELGTVGLKVALVPAEATSSQVDPNFCH